MSLVDAYTQYWSLPLDCEVRVDTVSVPLEEVLSFQTGAVIKTSTRVGVPLELVVGGVAVGQCEMEGGAARVTALGQER